MPLYTSMSAQIRPARKEINVPRAYCPNIYLYLYCDFNVLVYELFFSSPIHDIINNCNRIGRNLGEEKYYKEFKTTLKSLQKKNA